MDLNLTAERTPYAMDFTGRRSVTTRLTWGQQWVWDALSNLDDTTHMCIDLVHPVPARAGMKPERAARAVRALVHRYESLRTVFVPDERAAMGLRQQVLASGTLPLELWTVPRYREADAALVVAELSRLDFDVRDLPFRAVVLAEGGTVRLVAVRMSHMAADFWSAGILSTELWDELGLTSPEGPIRRGSPDWQPVDQAEFEAGGDGRRLCDRSLRFWRNQMRRFPATLFPHAGAPGDTPRYCEGRVTSSAAHAAVHLLSRRYGHASPPAVLTAAVMALVGAWSGTTGVGLPVIVSNRNTRRSQGMVGPMTEMAAMYVDVAGRRFADIARQTAHESMVAQRYSQYDIPRFQELQAETAAERDGSFELSSYLNVRVERGASPAPPDDERGHRAIAGLAERTTVGWNEGFDSYNVKLGLLADLWDGEVRLTIRADTRTMPRRDVAAILAGLDPLLIAALRAEGLHQEEVERIVAGRR